MLQRSAAACLLFILALAFCTTAAAEPTEEVFKCYRTRPELGGGFWPNCKTRWQKRIKDKLVFDVDFSTDSFGRRVTPHAEGGHRRGNTLFFGCSFILGEGVNGDETTPYYYSRLARDMNVYNYGGSGFGTQQMLVQLSRPDIRSEVDPRASRTIGIYAFLSFHVQRVAGKPSVYNTFARHFPYYSLDRDGQLVLNGSFKSGRPLLSSFYGFVNRFPFLESLLERWTEPATEHDILLTERVIEESARKFAEDFGSKDFFVLFFPGSDLGVNMKIKPLLDRAGIRYLDYSEALVLSFPENHLPDQHPSARVHRIIGESLAKDMARITGFW